MRVLFYRDCRALNRIQIAKATVEGTVVSDAYTVRPLQHNPRLMQFSRGCAMHETEALEYLIDHSEPVHIMAVTVAVSVAGVRVGVWVEQYQRTLQAM